MLPTYNLSHAVYRSRYLAFVHKDVLDNQNHYYQKLTPLEMVLYDHYSRWTKHCGAHDPQYFICTVFHGSSESTHYLPLVTVGGYLQTESQFLTPTILNDKAGKPLTFAAVQAALQTGQDPFAGSLLVADINGEANILTALICHADGSQPKKVCGRSIIKHLLHQVK